MRSAFDGLIELRRGIKTEYDTMREKRWLLDPYASNIHFVLTDEGFEPVRSLFSLLGADIEDFFLASKIVVET